MPFRIAIIDGHPRFRAGVRSLLHLHPDLDVVAELDELGAAAAALAGTPVDVLLLYADSGARERGPLRRLARAVKLIVVLAADRREDGLEAIRDGARGVLFERFAIDALVDAIRAVAAGNVWVPPPLQAQLVGVLSEPSDGAASPPWRWPHLAAVPARDPNGHTAAADESSTAPAARRPAAKPARRRRLRRIAAPRRGD